MSCAEFEAHLHPYVDGELGVGEMLGANAHLVRCPDCQGRVERERWFRQLLRRQPKESAPPEFHARIRARIRRSARVAALRPWLMVPAAAAALLLIFLLPGTRAPAPLVTADKKTLALGETVAGANCGPCHGLRFKGDGPAAIALNPKPADWTSVRVQDQTDGELFRKISTGRGAMPPWRHLSERERWAVIRFIKSLKS